MRIALITISILTAFLARAQEIHEVVQLDLGPLTEDYAPVLIGDGFVMCSIRETGTAIAFKDADTGKPLADLYWVPLNGDIPGTPILFSANLATPVNEGPASFSDEGNMIAFTRNQILPKRLANMKAANSQLGIFFSEKTNDVWGPPVSFEHNTTKYSTMHPAFDASGNTLVFASDMPGGYGGLDLYISTRTAMGWSVPENMGASINTEHNEGFPNIAPDGSMYFSSDRTGGSGKLDIYRSSWPNTERTAPVHLPAPINSPGNDLGMTVRESARTGLFSSDRDGKDRIYAFKKTVPKFRDCSAQIKNNYCYAFNAKPHAATRSLPLEHVWDLGDGTRVKDLVAEHCFAEPGNYQVRSLLVDRKTGSVFHELEAHELAIDDHFQAWISSPDTVRTGRALALDGTRSQLQGMVANEYHWDMGDGMLEVGLHAQHTFRKQGVYEVKLDVLSTPDANGIIRNRCNTRTIVVLDKFKDQEDMAVVATYQDALGKTHSFEYQELPPDHFGMTEDDFADATFSVELFASMERMSLDDPKFAEVRKLYRVVERFDPVRAVYTYSVGETNDMAELYKVFQKVKELQFLDAEVFQLQLEQLVDLSQLDLRSLEELNNTKLRTSAIHFEYKSADIAPGSEEVLDRITDMMRQHPEVRLVIEAHTDDIGSRSYNFELSEQRAGSVQAYLEAQGIAADRLVPVGHGKNQPIASNRTEEGRQENRRVEFRMTVKGEDHAFQKTR
ncbi:MAG: OmpA family protein [Flavobacteriales bacterium]|nr:OmpA family protein [Flavobacteriales bacterium]